MNDKYCTSKKSLTNKKLSYLTFIASFLLIPSFSLASKPLDAFSPQAGSLKSTPFVVGDAYRPGRTWIDAVAIGDIDGDGDKEIIAASEFNYDKENDFSIFIFHPINEELGTPERYAYESQVNRSGYGVSLEVADLDNNGIDEIVVGHDDGLTIFHQNGLGQLVSMLVPVPIKIGNLKSMDINLDGNLDLIGLSNPKTAYQFIGSGSFVDDNIIQYQIPFPTRKVSTKVLAIGDLNNNGYADLAVASRFGSNEALVIHYHDGINRFFPPRPYTLPGILGASGIAVGDVNGDQKNDIVLSKESRPPAHIFLFIQDEPGEWSDIITLPSYDTPKTLEIADLDLNGTGDIIVLHSGREAMGVYLNDGDVLGEEILVDLPYSLYSSEGLAIGDMNGDNCPETIVVAQNYHGVLPIHSTLCDHIQPVPIPEPTQGTYHGKIYEEPVEYEFNIAGGEATFQVDFTGKHVDLDIKLYNPYGTLVASSETQHNPEIIQYDLKYNRGKYTVEITNNSKDKSKTVYQFNYEARLID